MVNSVNSAALLLHLFTPFYDMPFLIVITAIFLVTGLRKNLQWKKEKISQGDKSSDKESGLVRIILAINTIFIVSYFPYVGIRITYMVHPKFSILSPSLGRLAAILLTFRGAPHSASSSVNIFFSFIT